MIQLVVVGDADGDQLGRSGHGTLGGDQQTGGIVEGIIQDDGMSNADVPQRLTVVIAEGAIDLLQDVEALDDVAEDGGLAVEMLGPVTERDDELTGRDALVRIDGAGCGGHTDGAPLGMGELRIDLGCEDLPAWPVDDAPDGRSAVAGGRPRSDRIARLEREAGLDIVDGREVVVLDLTELEEANARAQRRRSALDRRSDDRDGRGPSAPTFRSSEVHDRPEGR